MKETVESILNKLYAMYLIDLVTLQDIADGVGERSQRVSDWVTVRRRRPDGEATLKLLAFAAKQSNRIAHFPKLQPQYRRAFNRACELFPLTGERKKL